MLDCLLDNCTTYYSTGSFVTTATSATKETRQARERNGREREDGLCRDCQPTHLPVPHGEITLSF